MSEVRAWALSLPESAEEPHHEIASFRVRGKIFATIPDDRCVRVMAGEDEIRAAATSHPDVCHLVYWGKRLACVGIDVDAAPDELVRDLLTEAWLRKAPPALAKAFTAPC
jgi:hypothetical protein